MAVPLCSCYVQIRLMFTVIKEKENRQCGGSQKTNDYNIGFHIIDGFYCIVNLLKNVS